MATITKIEAQTKNKDRVNIFLDGEFRLGCSLELALTHHLKEGVEISELTLDELVFENEKSVALTKAVTLIGKNLKTKSQLKKYLTEKGYSEQIVNYVLEKLSEYNYINDENYARIYVRSVKNKYGKIKIKNELKLKGISEKIIDDVLSEFESEEDVILTLANKYLKGKEASFENLNKLYRFLLSKGFEYEEVSRVIKNFKEN